MANYANTAGPRARNDRTDERHPAAWLAALWPSSLDAGQRRAHPRRPARWRKHLSNGALAALLLGLTAVGGPSMIHPGEGGHWLKGWTPPQSSNRSGAAYGAIGHGAASGGSDDTAAHGGSRWNGPHGLQTTPVLEMPGDHAAFVPQELKGDIVLSDLSELHSYGPTRTHFFGAGYGGRPGGRSGGGGAPGGQGPSSGGPGQSGQQQDLAPPEAPPGQDTPPHYVVDPADGPHDPTEGWKPATQPLSAVPEPQTWLMMLFGFGTLGCMLRARRGQQVRLDA